MAQTGFMLSDEGRTISVLNDSGTTAITAGDIVYTPTNNDVLSGTAAGVRNSYAIGDIKVKSMLLGNTNYKLAIGVALEDIPADGYGAVAMEGVFITPAKADTEAGDAIMGAAATANKVTKIADAVMATATTTGITNIKNSVDAQRYRIGKALTGGSADGKYIIWKMTF